MAAKKFSFKANIRIKDIIGQGLINNSNIAIIELIKNARDAGSTRVNVTFEKADKISENSKIVVQDFGNGMDLDDIDNKWLNIAYSEKRNSKKMTAGDKGIGRFSCDRLGKKLNLYTKKSNDDIAHLFVDWEDFEIDDQNKEISFVKLNAEYISSDAFIENTKISPFKKGTCLVIEDLREAWGKNELEKLQRELERFIIDPESEFTVYLRSEDFKDKDGVLIFDGAVENKLLAKLDDKTISIHSEIIDNGKVIRTEIRHYGSKIVSFDEDNMYSELRDVKAQIHYLSSGAKISFKSITGYHSADYASVMLFFNGFRVLPYGEPKDDWLGLNQRKAQGTMRFLGTRELFGIIEVKDNRRHFSPVSSREGMEHNRAFKQLTDPEFSDLGTSFLTDVLGTLEKYVVNGLDWDRVRPKEGEFSVEEIESAIKLVFETYKKKKKPYNVRIDYKKISQIAEKKVREYREFVDNLTERLSSKSVYDLTPSEKQDLKKYVQRHDTVLEQKDRTNKEYKHTIEVEKKRRLFAEQHLTSDTQRVRNLQHLIGILNGEVCDELESILRAEAKQTSEVSNEYLNIIKNCFFKASKVRTLSQIITKANFDMMSEKISMEVFSYIQQYIQDMRKNGAAWRLSVKFENKGDNDLKRNMSPIEMSMLVDNILNNSYKANAKNILIRASLIGKEYAIEFIDDGDGLPDKYKPEELFNAGISTTRRGAGIGLAHVKQITEDVGAKVEIFSNRSKGVTLRIWWKK